MLTIPEDIAGTMMGSMGSGGGASNSGGTMMTAASTSANAPIRRRLALLRNSLSWASLEPA